MFNQRPIHHVEHLPSRFCSNPLKSSRVVQIERMKRFSLSSLKITPQQSPKKSLLYTKCNNKHHSKRSHEEEDYAAPIERTKKH